jgi:uncharacterized damage-inducible protein DinB
MVRLDHCRRMLQVEKLSDEQMYGNIIGTTVTLQQHLSHVYDMILFLVQSILKTLSVDT